MSVPIPFPFRIAAALALAGAACVASLSSWAQDAPGDDAPPVVEVATVEAALAGMEADGEITAEGKDVLRKQYLQAIKEAKAAAEHAAKTAAYREAIASGPAKVADLNAQLDALPPVESAARVTTGDNTEALQNALESTRVALSGMKDDLAKVEGELKELEERPAEIVVRQPEAQRELAAAREDLKDLKSPDLAGEPDSPGRVAERMLREARVARLAAELEMLKQEQLSAPARDDLLQARRDLLTRQVENAGALVEALAEEVNKRLAGEAKEMVALVGQTLPEVGADDKAGQELLVEVQVLATEFEELVDRLRQASAEQGETRALLDALVQEFEFIQEHLKLGGSGEAVALFDLQERLPGRGVLTQRARIRKAQLDKARLGLLHVEKKRRGQGAVERRFAGRSEGTVTQLVTTRKEVLDRLSAQYRALNQVLVTLNLDGEQHQLKVGEARGYVFEQLYRVRCSPSVDAGTLRDLPGGIGWFFSTGHWGELAHSIWRGCLRAPWRTGMVVAAVAALLLMRRRLGGMIMQSGMAVRRVSADNYAATVRALLATVLLAIPFPILFGYLGWTIAQDPDASAWLRGSGRALRHIAWITLGLSFLAAACREEGLGIDHFRWRVDAVKRFRWGLHCFALGVIPGLLLVFCTLFGEGGLYFHSLGRIALVVVLLWTVYLLWRLFRFSDGLFAPWIADGPSRLVVRWRYVWFPLLLAAPLALVVLAGAGYLVTALHLSLELLTTMGLVAGAVFLYWLTLRWFMIKERRLALAKAIEERRARREEAASGEEEQAGEEVPLGDEEDEPDLSSIGDQTRNLLRSAFTVAVVLAIGVLWSHTIPLVSVLKEVSVIGRLSLLELGQIGLIVVVTWIAVRDLPGVLELAVLRSTKLAVGTRAAIATLCQYAAIAIGLVFFFQVFQVDWSSLGWIAAALSVGLGFGLQEVVANFVCGLILLFERPVRVGDIVTVDGTTGKVARIHLRATTILNWERQEYVVPNKNLITSAILNWTLSNSINRVLIAVGVAYGSDTAKAREILLEVAADNPLILDDPEPRATFEEFGDSALTLRLRAFLPAMDDRIRVITELHDEIHRRFAEAGITIAFPQRDLHIRNWTGKDGSVPMAGESGNLSEST